MHEQQVVLVGVAPAFDAPDDPRCFDACRLGYTEPSSFVRAFRRWTGRAPQSHRREQ